MEEQKKQSMEEQKKRGRPRGARYLPDPESQRRGAAKGNAAKSARIAFKRLFGDDGAPEPKLTIGAAHTQCVCRREGEFLRCQPDCPLHGLSPKDW